MCTLYAKVAENWGSTENRINLQAKPQKTAKVKPVTKRYETSQNSSENGYETFS